MINELNELKQKICKISVPPQMPQEKIDTMKEEVVVALMAGGESSRFKSVLGSENTNKNSFKLPNGDTMIEMTIRMYRRAGIKKFVALVYHHASSIVNILGDGSNLGVEIKYSYDPDRPIGKGGAVLNAYKNGSISENSTLIIHNPDDVIIDYNGDFPLDIINAHLYGLTQNSLATVVVTEGTPYNYSGMSIIDNVVTDIQYEPIIPIPTHIGVTVFSPKCLSYFKDNIDLSKKTDFETVLFPILSKERKLFAYSIPNENWIAVNNLKSYNTLIKRMGLN